jgi:hypothetical protein
MDIHCPKCQFRLTEWLKSTFDFPFEKARSYRQLQQFHATVKDAYIHWPELHDFEPANPEHLRAYVLVKSGHYGIMERSGQIDDGIAEEIKSVLEGFGKFTAVRPGRDKYFIYYPLSISYAELAHRQAGPVFDAAYLFIAQQFGLSDIEEFKKNVRSAA